MENVFTTLKKVPLYLAGFAPSTEPRKAGEEKIINLTVETSLDAKLASAFDADQILRRTLFRLNNTDPVGYIQSASFRIPFKRQTMEIFATLDTPKATLLFDQVLVDGVRVRVEKKSQLYTLVLTLAFGPVSKSELEFCQQWYTQTKAVTFADAQPNLDFDVEPEDEDRKTARRPTPMFDDPRDGATSAAPAETETSPASDVPDKEPARQLPRRGGDKPSGPRRVH